MPVKLVLIRHCKSSWDAFGRDDHERVLNERGRAAAPLIGQWLAARGHVPDAVLCSDATRTRETWDLIRGAIQASPDVIYSRGLYLAPDLAMLEHLRRARGQTVAVIGHNPGIAEFAANLAHLPPDHGRFSDYPTGATTVMTFDVGNWADVTEGHGLISDFVVPSDLKEHGAG